MRIEAFVYLALFLFFGLLTVFIRWLKGEFEKSTNQKRTTTFPDIPQENHEIETTEADRLSRPDHKGKLFSSTSMVPTRKRRKPRIDLRTTKDLRQGIVLMTVLGPCRAFEPPAEFRNLWEGN